MTQQSIHDFFAEQRSQKKSVTFRDRSVSPINFGHELVKDDIFPENTTEQTLSMSSFSIHRPNFHGNSNHLQKCRSQQKWAEISERSSVKQDFSEIFNDNDTLSKKTEFFNGADLDIQNINEQDLEELNKKSDNFQSAQFKTDHTRISIEDPQDIYNIDLENLLENQTEISDDFLEKLPKKSHIFEYRFSESKGIGSFNTPAYMSRAYSKGLDDYFGDMVLTKNEDELLGKRPDIDQDRLQNIKKPKKKISITNFFPAKNTCERDIKWYLFFITKQE